MFYTFLTSDLAYLKAPWASLFSQHHSTNLLKKKGKGFGFQGRRRPAGIKGGCGIFEVVKMITDGILRVKTCVLKVGIHCDGCKKKVTKVLSKIEGVYQIDIEKLEGKVTVTGQMDLDTVFYQLRKAGKRAHLWGATANPGVPSHVQQLQLGGGGGDQQLKDNGGNGQPKGGAGADATMAMPQATPQQLREQLQQQLMKGMQLPPQLMGMGGKMPLPAAAAPANPKAVKFNVPGNDDDESGDEFDDDEDFEDDGLDDDMYDDAKMMMKPMAMPPAAGGAGGSGVKKGGTGNVMPVQVKGNASNGGKMVPGAKLNLSGAGGSGKNGGAVQPRNGKGGAPGGGNLQPGQGKKVSGAGGPSAGIGGPMMGMGGMPPPQPAAMTMRPPNMMGGAGGYPAAGREPCPWRLRRRQQQQQPQPQQMMMNGCYGSQGYYGDHAHGGAGYYQQQTGYGSYGYGYGHHHQLPYPSYYPRHPHDNMFSDENPNSYCSVM
ncbi:neurogenic protein mastermind-like [Panicum miliaceum]|uniref:Neurogenic protein mastermind-like n=1 Tax=Panicum miliaceum TaxID=4540 RepID=A0A3L6Q483_PANMI|nr:neurogenic protein mastermind-like [Panicum miliaceum]